MTSDQLLAFTAVMSFLATTFAAYATWKGPSIAAQLAEKLRQNSEVASERRRMKLHIFATVMQERATMQSIECVRMLNSIDFVYNDCQNVRDAWAELYTVYKTPPMNEQLREDKVRSLLRAMAVDLELSDSLRPDDFGRTYYPNALAWQDQVRDRQLQAQLAGLQGQAAKNEPADDFANRFPPPPQAIEMKA